MFVAAALGAAVGEDAVSSLAAPGLEVVAGIGLLGPRFLGWGGWRRFSGWLYLSEACFKSFEASCQFGSELLLG